MDKTEYLNHINRLVDEADNLLSDAVSDFGEADAVTGHLASAGRGLYAAQTALIDRGA